MQKVERHPTNGSNAQHFTSSCIAQHSVEWAQLGHLTLLLRCQLTSGKPSFATDEVLAAPRKLLASESGPTTEWLSTRFSLVRLMRLKMSHISEAHRQIRAALTALEKARDELSAALLKRSGNTKDQQYAELQDLNSKVTKAATLLPHGGER